MLGSLASGKGFHNTVRTLFFCTLPDVANLSVDLNCDLGESFGVYEMGDDAQIIPNITSANVACGYHAGDPLVMRATVHLAVTHGVAVGAHPGFPDLVGFGRRALQASPAEVENLVLYQLGALAGIVAAEGGRLAHVKPHGALYNMASVQAPIAEAVARAVSAFDSGLVLFGLSGSRLLDAGRAAGLQIASEVFADRAYLPDGTLMPRSTAGAVVYDSSAVVERAVGMVTGGVVTAVNGEAIPVLADTICIHGDTPNATELAVSVRRGLEAAGVNVASIRS